MYNSTLNKLSVSLFFILISLLIIISTNSYSFIKNNYESILSLSILFIGSLVLLSMLDIKFGKNVIVNTKLKEPLNTIKLANSFCDASKSVLDLNKKCNSLTKENCNVTSCCIWLNGNKCVAGDDLGPTFLSDDKNNEINVDYYYYKNICKGKGCPNVTESE